MSGPYPDRQVAQRIRVVLEALGEVAPTVQAIQRWRPRQRQDVERWAARELLVRGGHPLRPITRPKVINTAPAPGLRSGAWGIQVNPSKARRRRERDRGKYADQRHLAIVRTMPCSAAELDHEGCSRGDHRDPHHAGEGLGCPDPERRKTCDRTAIAMCRSHHRTVETLTGPFAGWTKERRRAWYDEEIARTRAYVLAAGRSP